jgi:hypothetical protein
MCELCGGPLLSTICLRCVIALDDAVHALILAQIGEELQSTLSDDDWQRLQFRRVLSAYTAAVARTRRPR